jgi:transketolase
MSTAAVGIEQLTINTIRTLSMDAVQKADSGHPGTPMALAPVTYKLWRDVLRYDPNQPLWPARDRFILSCGHASMLLYSVLHLAGVKQVSKTGEVTDRLSITLQHIQDFRQLGSPCAGHPEYGEAAGIETTTGPLGQGIANSVGMAMAARWFAARYNRPGFPLFDYDVYALCSDGDVMEGVGCEAASVAGHLALSNLCWIYDDNKITIEGHTELAFTEDTATRFRGLGWQTVVVEDANDLQAIEAAFELFRQTQDRPTIIILRSIIGYGSPNKANSHSAHGSPLGAEEVKLTKQVYGWPEDAQFLVPEEAAKHFSEGVAHRGHAARAAWQTQFDAYAKSYPTEAAELRAIWSGQLPAGWEDAIPSFEPNEKGVATRASSGQVLNSLAAKIPWLLGGSADLAPSNNTLLKFNGAGDFQAGSYGGRNLHFGVREHSMAAICNGLALSGLRPYAGTFFVFTDYLRPALRLSALMHQPVLYILTHDSIGLGEDGPTHQPVEHLAACRAIPRLLVMRPADANEVAEAYRVALSQTNRPVALVLTRQNLPTLNRQQLGAASSVRRGGYILSEATGGVPQVILMSTGSEVPICLRAQQLLASQGVRARVVSMPCCELFDEQDVAYRESVLPPAITARVAVEAGIGQSWYRYLGLQGHFIGLSEFGASGPYEELYRKFGLTPENVAQTAYARVHQP